MSLIAKQNFVDSESNSGSNIAFSCMFLQFPPVCDIHSGFLSFMTWTFFLWTVGFVDTQWGLSKVSSWLDVIMHIYNGSHRSDAMPFIESEVILHMMCNWLIPGILKIAMKVFGKILKKWEIKFLNSLPLPFFFFFFGSRSSLPTTPK